MTRVPTLLAVTGAGSVSPFGIGTEALWRGVCECRNCFSTNQDWATASGSHGVAGRIASVETPVGFPARFRRIPRAYQFALLAADQALRQAKLEPASESESVGLFFCTDHGAEEQSSQFLDDLFLKSPRLVRPLLFQNTTFAAGAGELSLHYRIKGPSYTLTSGFHGFIQALTLASAALSAGRIRYALVVACDELTRLQYQVLSNLGVLAKSSTTRPYDDRRDGVIPAEGAAAELDSIYTQYLSDGYI